MPGKTRLLAPAGGVAALARVCLVRVRPLLSKSRLQLKFPINQIQPSRRLCISSRPQTAELRPAGPKEPRDTQKESSKQQTPQPTRIGQLGRLLRVTRHFKFTNFLNLVFEHHTYARIPLLWFRDACPCALCVTESSGQKNFATCDIDERTQLKSSRILEDGSLELVWDRDFMRGGLHTSTFPLRFLQRLLVNNAVPDLYEPERFIWDRAAIEKNMEAKAINYDAWMAGGEPFARSLMELCQWGLILVKGVPESKDAVKEIANKIGNLQSTFYGETWDVISKPNAENVAYTNEYLCLHQDLMYYSDVPHIQLLHCIKNDCQGGDSLFSDGFRAAAEFRQRSPITYSTLAGEPVTFQYSRNGHFYRQFRALFNTHTTPDLDSQQLPMSIHWSPPFQGPFPQTGQRKRLLAWYRAAKAFQKSVEAPENMLQYRLQPGDCVLFDNWRVLHGRTKFDTSSGLRHLHGAYLSRQTMLSAVRRETERGHISPGPNQLESRVAELDQAIAWYGKAIEQTEKHTSGQVQEDKALDAPTKS